MLKIYARFMILLNSSHMYVLIFKTCPCMTYICTTIGPTPKFFDYRPLGLDISGSWPGHVQILGSWVYKGDPYPLRTLGFYFNFHSISCSDQGLSR
jgi:hypothetical protein